MDINKQNRILSSNVHLQHVLSTIHVMTNMSILTEGFVDFLYFFQVFFKKHSNAEKLG